MKRRSFLRMILGLFGISIVGLPKETEGIPTPPPKVGDVYYKANGADEIQEWMNNTFGMMNFSPDEIISVENIGDRLVVFCKYSIWEIEENCYGDGLQRKQLNYCGTKD